MVLESHCVAIVCLKKRMLLRPPRSIFNCHRVDSSKRHKDMKLILKHRLTKWYGTRCSSSLPTSLSNFTPKKSKTYIDRWKSHWFSWRYVVNIAYQDQEILVNYFDSKCDGYKCRLFFSLVKSRSMIVVRINLRIKMINSYEPSSHIVISLVYAFSTIGNKSHSKDHNASRCMFSQSIKNKRTRSLQLLKPTSKLVNLDIKTLHRYCS